jgi:hypothetical protein
VGVAAGVAALLRGYQVEVCDRYHRHRHGHRGPCAELWWGRGLPA